MSFLIDIRDWMAIQWGEDFLLALGIKSMLILGIAFLLNWRLKKFSVSVKHFIWVVAFGALLALPFFNFQQQEFHIGLYNIQPEKPTLVHEADGFNPALKTQEASSPVVVKSDHKYGLSDWLVIAWFVGIGILTLVMVFEMVWLWMISMLKTDAPRQWNDILNQTKIKLNVSRRIKLIASHKIGVPLTFGFIRPIIILPKIAETWDEQRLSTVFIHELAHIKRYDYLANFAVNIATIFFWYNPLVWVAGYKHRVTMEKSCDDYVLNQDIKATTYAMQLVQIARGNTETNILNRRAVGLADYSGLKQRIMSILKNDLAREALGLRRMVVITVVAIMLTIPLTGLNFNRNVLTEVLNEVKITYEQAIINLRSTNQSERLEASQSLENSYDIRLISPVLRAVKHETETEVLASMIKAVGKFGSNRTFYQLATHMNNPNPEVRIAAIEALTSISCLPSYLMIEESLNDEDSEVREAAKANLKNIKSHKLRSSINGFCYTLLKDDETREEIADNFSTISGFSTIDNFKASYFGDIKTRNRLNAALKQIARTGNYNQLTNTILKP